MYTSLACLVDCLDRNDLSQFDVIHWGAPVPAFGDPSRATVATLGLNPSNREFVNNHGEELDGQDRRFHTLRSLNLETWSEADSSHLNKIELSCISYFASNPYDRWFKVLDRLLEATGTSFYDLDRPACHLDLIPFATSKKWTELSSAQRAVLLSISGDTFGKLLSQSATELLVLNGKTVVEHFQAVTGVELEACQMSEWSLPRMNGRNVPGVAYWGTVDEIGSCDLGRKLMVLGYNHNLQSSFGVTKEVVQAIQIWIEGKVQERLYGDW